MVETLLRDVRFAFRTTLNSPIFAAAVVLTVALAVGATTSIFAAVDAILLQPLPFPGAERAVMFCETSPAIGDHCAASPMNVADWARSTPSLEAAGVARAESFILQNAGETTSVVGGLVSPGFFATLGTRAALGRLIADGDVPRGSNHVVVVSDGFWRGRLAADRSVIGRSIILDETPFTVIGVLPADVYAPSSLLADVEVWKPLTAGVDDAENRRWRGFLAIGRRRAGVAPATLTAELDTVRARLAAAYPAANRDWGLRMVDLKTAVVGDVRPTLWIFLGAAVFVLLIACSNVASLFLVRAASRNPEFAVRASLGASRRRLVQQLVAESLVLSLAGGALGVLLASWVTAGFVALAPASIPRLAEVAIDVRVVAFAFALSVGTALVFGFAPARRAWSADLNATLKDVRNATNVDGAVRGAFVVAQISLALMLLVGAGLLARSFARQAGWNPGFDRAGLVTTWLLPPRSVEDTVAVLERVRDEVAALPGVASASLASAGPLFGGTEPGKLSIDGRPPFTRGEEPTVEWFDVGVRFFETLGVRVVRGRTLTTDDRGGGAPVCVVNETFAKRFFPNENPLGRRVTVQDHPADIVGVVGDMKPFRPSEAAAPQVYWPIQQYRRGAAYLVIRTTPGTAGVEKAVRARIAAVHAGIQVSPFLSIDERVSKRLVAPRFSMLLLAAFAFVATCLAGLGVYGVMSHLVSSRSREIAVRIALGAVPAGVLRSVVGRGMLIAGIGIAVGSLGALALGRLMTSLLYGLPANDGPTLLGAAGLLTVVALAACWLPGRRASRVDPIAALRMQ